MKRVLTRTQVKRFKMAMLIFGVWMLGTFVHTVVA